MASMRESSVRGGFAVNYSRPLVSSSRPRAIDLTELKQAPPRRNERFVGVPRLPACWHRGFDRTIACLEKRGFDYDMIFARICQMSPDLASKICPSMIERRLLALDEIVEVDYWRVDTKDDSQYILEQEKWVRMHRAQYPSKSFDRSLRFGSA